MRDGMRIAERGLRNTECGIKGSELGGRRSKLRKFFRKIFHQLFTILFLTILCLQSLAFASEKWAGVDESVVKKYAEEQGRKAWKPIINTDQGDLPLFLFLLAGAVGGFIAGYYWRALMVERSSSQSKEKAKS